MKCPACGREASDTGGPCPGCRTVLPSTVLTDALTPVPGEDAQTIWSAVPPQPADDDIDTTGLPASAGGVRHVGTSKSASGPLEMGQQFGARYHILKQLGVGGMGAVYQAWDAELEVAVALKVIRPEVTRDPAAALDIERRFKQELLLARQVTHRNVVRIHDLGEINGIKYITMPYIEGSDLSTVLRERKLTIPQVVAIAREIAAGLQAAHDAGVVHRDLKPANVMIENEHAIIMDFGIARSTSRGGARPSTRPPTASGQLGVAVDDDVTRVAATVVGEVIGTIEYMAPEQARGEHVDQRADVYAFGLIVYDMLAGRRRSEHAVSAVGELQGRLAHAPPSIRSVVPAVPEALDALVTKCVEPDLEKRYQTTAELVAVLDRLDDNGKLKPKKHVVRMPIAVAVASALLTLSGYIYWVTRPPVVHDPVSIVMADFHNNTGDATLDRTLEPVMKLALEGASFISVYDRSAIRSRLGVPPPEILDERAAQEIAVRQGVSVVLAGVVSQGPRGYDISVKAVRAATGDVVADTSDRATSKDRILEVVSDLAGEVRSALGDDTSDEARRFAMATWTANSMEVVHDFALAAEALSNTKYEEAREGYQRAIQREPTFGPGYVGLAVVSLAQERQQDAEKYMTEAMRHVDRMTERERLAVRGLYYLVSGDYESCAKEYADLIARYAQDSAAHNNLAICSAQVREMSKAVATMRRVVEILPRRSLYRSNLSFYAAYAGDFQTAEQEARTAQEMKSRWAGVNVAFANLGQRRVAQAGQAYQELAQVDAWGKSQAASGLGDLAIFEGRYGEAIRILEEGARDDLAAQQPERAADKFIAIAHARLAKGEETAAVAAAGQALQHRNAIKTRFMAARIFVAVRDLKRAQPLASELAKERLAEPRAYAQILNGEIALSSGDSSQAIVSFNAANDLLDTWIGHLDLGQAYLAAGLAAETAGQAGQAAGLFAQADSEFDRCLKRHGEALSLFLDNEVTYGMLPPVYYYQGRAREGLKTAGFAESYRAYLEIRGRSNEDKMAKEASRRAGAAAG